MRKCYLRETGVSATPSWFSMRCDPRRGVLAGTLLAFARALGEFGATIMVAGNIPGQTTTLSVAIYQHVQLGEDGRAWTLAAVAAGLAFLAVWSSERLLRRRKGAP